MDAEDIVVGREHVHGGRVVEGVGLDGHLGVVDAREVAGTSGLVLLGLEREGVRVHTGVRGTSVVVEGLHLVEVLTLLLLEAVLAVKDELELLEGTDRLLGEVDGGTGRANGKHGRTRQRGGHEAVGRGDGGHVGRDGDVVGVSGEVPQGRSRGGVGEAPHELLDGVVVGQTHLLDLGRIDGVGTGVLDLLDQVLVTLLGVAATLLGVKVDVVSPHLEGTLVKVSLHVGGDVDVDTDLVVLERNEGQVETGVAVEEEDQRKVHGLAGSRRGHLTPRSLLGLVEVKLGVQTPPLLVVLVDALTTDGQLNIVDGTLSNPARARVIRGARLELEVHVTDEITVTGDSHRHAAGVGGSTVDGLLDVLHSEVGVALVFGLEEGHLRVTGKVDILGTVSDELHKTASHFESFCTIYGENNFSQTRISRPRFFSDQIIMTTHPDEISKDPIEETDTETETEDEIEEGEIVSEGELGDFEDEEDEGLDIAGLMTSLMATPDGDTVCSALVTIGQQMQMQNKILIKILSELKSA